MSSQVWFRKIQNIVFVLFGVLLLFSSACSKEKSKSKKSGVAVAPGSNLSGDGSIAESQFGTGATMGDLDKMRDHILSKVGSDISAEAAARIAADTTLTNSINKINGEITRLTNELNAEVAARKKEDLAIRGELKDLGVAIRGEMSAKETALRASITSLGADLGQLKLDEIKNNGDLEKKMQIALNTVETNLKTKMSTDISASAATLNRTIEANRIKAENEIAKVKNDLTYRIANLEAVQQIAQSNFQTIGDVNELTALVNLVGSTLNAMKDMGGKFEIAANSFVACTDASEKCASAFLDKIATDYPGDFASGQGLSGIKAMLLIEYSEPTADNLKDLATHLSKVMNENFSSFVNTPNTPDTNIKTLLVQYFKAVMNFEINVANHIAKKDASGLVIEGWINDPIFDEILDLRSKMTDYLVKIKNRLEDMIVIVQDRNAIVKKSADDFAHFTDVTSLISADVKTLQENLAQEIEDRKTAISSASDAINQTVNNLSKAFNDHVADQDVVNKNFEQATQKLANLAVDQANALNTLEHNFGEAKINEDMRQAGIAIITQLSGLQMSFVNALKARPNAKDWYDQVFRDRIAAYNTAHPTETCETDATAVFANAMGADAMRFLARAYVERIILLNSTEPWKTTSPFLRYFVMASMENPSGETGCLPELYRISKTVLDDADTTKLLKETGKTIRDTMNSDVEFQRKFVQFKNLLNKQAPSPWKDHYEHSLKVKSFPKLEEFAKDPAHNIDQVKAEADKPEYSFVTAVGSDGLEKSVILATAAESLKKFVLSSAQYDTAQGNIEETLQSKQDMFDLAIRTAQNATDIAANSAADLATKSAIDARFGTLEAKVDAHKLANEAAIASLTNVMTQSDAAIYTKMAQESARLTDELVGKIAESDLATRTYLENKIKTDLNTLNTNIGAQITNLDSATKANITASIAASELRTKASIAALGTAIEYTQQQLTVITSNVEASTEALSQQQANLAESAKFLNEQMRNDMLMQHDNTLKLLTQTTSDIRKDLNTEISNRELGQDEINNKLDGQILAQGQQINALTGRMAGVESKVAELEKWKADLATGAATIQSNTAGLQSAVEAHTTEINNLKGDMQKMAQIMAAVLTKVGLPDLILQLSSLNSVSSSASAQFLTAGVEPTIFQVQHWWQHDSRAACNGENRDATGALDQIGIHSTSLLSNPCWVNFRSNSDWGSVFFRFFGSMDFVHIKGYVNPNDETPYTQNTTAGSLFYDKYVPIEPEKNYKAGFKALKARVASGEPLTGHNKEFEQNLPGYPNPLLKFEDNASGPNGQTARVKIAEGGPDLGAFDVFMYPPKAPLAADNDGRDMMNYWIAWNWAYGNWGQSYKFYPVSVTTAFGNVIDYKEGKNWTKTDTIAKLGSAAVDADGSADNVYKLSLFSPLVLDFTSIGRMPTLSNSSRVRFDHEADGVPEVTGWVHGREGAFLALDLNQNGKIDSGRELFGEGTMLKNGKRARNAYEALSQYDFNADKVIDAKDSIFSKLIVWFDNNANGISESREMESLNQAKVTSLPLDYKDVAFAEQFDSGNMIKYKSRFFGPENCPKDGCRAYDVYFGVTQSYSRRAK